MTTERLQRRSQNDLVRDLRWGASRFTALGVILSLIVLAASLMRSGNSNRFGIGLWLAITIYVFGGFLAGLVVGLLRPATRTLLGQILVGFVAMLPLAALVVELAIPPAERAMNGVGFVLLVAAVLGPVYAIALWLGRNI